MSGPAKTIVQDMLYLVSGVPFTGVLDFSVFNDFTSPDGYAVGAGRFQVGVTNGAVNIALIPTIGSSPAGCSYNVRYTSNPSLEGIMPRESWTVPQSDVPVPLSAVRTVPAPKNPNVLIPLSQIESFDSTFGVQRAQVMDSLSSGHNDLLTSIPSGQRGTLVGTITNSSDSTLTVYPEFKDTTGAYWPIYDMETSIPAGQSALVTFAGIILEFGENFSLNASGSGASFIGTLTTFNVSLSVYTVKGTSLASGSNTLLTASCTTYLKSAPSVGSNGFAVGVVNISGSTQNPVDLNYVPSGGSPQVIAQSLGLANDRTLEFDGPLGMLAGDELTVSLPESGFWSWVTIQQV